MATQVKERVHVCHMPSIVGKCEQFLNEKLVVKALNLSTEAYTGCSALGLPNIAMLIYEPFFSNKDAFSTHARLSATTPPRAF
jgi:hypothetical protein